jgi:uncharacterized protein (DUF1499 family)
MSKMLPRVAFILALAALVTSALGPLGARLGLLAPLQGFLLFAVGILPLALVALVASLLALVVTRGGSHPEGRSRALQSTVISGVLVVVFAVLARGGSDVPPIHDITTNPADAPEFVVSASHPDNAGRDLSYPHGGDDVSQQQLAAYPDLAPIEVAAAPADAFTRAMTTAEELGWQVVDADPSSGRIEATVTSSIFRFVDDVVVRVRPADSGSVIDLRSTSRVGQSDLGANADRIRAFRDAL